MLIYYVHHGERDKGNPPTQDDKITKLGEKDAINVGEMFYNSFKMKGTLNKVKAIYTSPYYRCRHTADLMNRQMKIEIIEDDRLNEFNSKNETWENLQQRVRDSLYDIVCKYGEEDIVFCVTSGVNLAAFTSIAYGLKPSNDAPFMHVHSCSVIGFNITKEKFGE